MGASVDVDTQLYADTFVASRPTHVKPIPGAFIFALKHFRCREQRKNFYFHSREDSKCYVVFHSDWYRLRGYIFNPPLSRH